MRLSYSSIDLFHNCGIAYENRYEKNLKTPSSVSLVVGQSVDAAVNADLANKRWTGELLPIRDVHDIVIGRIAEQFARDVVVFDPNAIGWMQSRDGARTAAIAMATERHLAAAPEINPTEVQRYWEIERNGHTINGYMDIQESGIIRDTKTSYRSPDPNSAHESKQLTMYSWASREIDGKLPNKVVLDFLVHTPARGDTKLVQLESTRSNQDVEELMPWIDSALESIGVKDFRPAVTGHWLCQKKFCGYWATCPHAQPR